MLFLTLKYGVGGRPAPLPALATGFVVSTIREKVELLSEVEVAGADSSSEGWEQKPSPGESRVLWEDPCSRLQHNSNAHRDDAL